MKNLVSNFMSFATANLKATRTVAGIIAFVAVMGFSMFACGGDDSDDGNGGGGSNVVLTGTKWVGSDGGNIITLEFTSSTQAKLTSPSGTSIFSYTVSNNTITLTASGDTMVATISGNTMTLQDAGKSITLIKDTSSGGGGKAVDSNLIGKWEWEKIIFANGTQANLPSQGITSGGYIYTSNSFSIYQNGNLIVTNAIYTENNNVYFTSDNQPRSTYSISGNTLTINTDASFGGGGVIAKKVTSFNWER
jgi:hypothetical protein